MTDPLGKIIIPLHGKSLLVLRASNKFDKQVVMASHGPAGPAGAASSAVRPWWKNPAIIVPSIVAILAATLGVVIPFVFSGEDRTPEVTNISPSKVVPGNQFDIHGKNLDLVSEVLFVKGATQIRLDAVRQQRTLWTVIPSANDVSPDEYSLTLRTNEGVLVPTGINVNVGDSFVETIEPTDTPVPEPTDNPAAKPTDTPTTESTDTPEPTPTNTPVPEPTDTHVPASRFDFEDDFSNSSSGWVQDTTADYEMGYVGGEYRILVKKQGPGYTALFKDLTFADFDAQVQARNVGQELNQIYGLVFLSQSSWNKYAFWLHPTSGTYSLRKWEGSENQGSQIAIVDWTESSAINRGNTTNTLRVVARSTEIRLYANGELLSTVDGATPVPGQIGLSATNFRASGPDGAEVYFDNFKVHSLN